MFMLAFTDRNPCVFHTSGSLWNYISNHHLFILACYQKQRVMLFIDTNLDTCSVVIRYDRNV